MINRPRQVAKTKIRPAESVSSNRCTSKTIHPCGSARKSTNKQLKTTALKNAITPFPPIHENEGSSKGLKKKANAVQSKQKPTKEAKLQEDATIEREQTKKKNKEIMRHVKLFDYKMGIFKDHFRISAVFKWNCKNPYDEIDKTYRNLCYMEEQEKLLDKKVDLFKLNCPLKIVKKQLKQAKKLWDLINIIMPQLLQWKQLTENYLTLEFVCNNFKDDLRRVDNLKGCQAYDRLMENINYMLKCIITVGEIRDPHMRESLWKELMDKAKVIKFLEPKNDFL